MNAARIAHVLVGCAAILGIARADLPQTMRAAAIDHTGGPEVLTLHTVAVPAAGADEVLIALHTVGLGKVVLQIR
jgi:hypothetical protein